MGETGGRRSVEGGRKREVGVVNRKEGGERRGARGVGATREAGEVVRVEEGMRDEGVKDGGARRAACRAREAGGGVRVEEEGRLEEG